MKTLQRIAAIAWRSLLVASGVETFFHNILIGLVAAWLLWALSAKE